MSLRKILIFGTCFWLIGVSFYFLIGTNFLPHILTDQHPYKALGEFYSETLSRDIDTAKTIYNWHLFFGIPFLVIGALQLRDSFRKESFRRHRILGYIYFFLGILANISGLVLLKSPKGGLHWKITIVLFSLFWTISAAVALRAAIQRNFKKHEAWMLRNYSIALFPGFMRIFFVLLLLFPEISKDEAFSLSGWLGFVASLVISQYAIDSKFKT